MKDINKTISELVNSGISTDELIARIQKESSAQKETKNEIAALVNDSVESLVRAVELADEDPSLFSTIMESIADALEIDYPELITEMESLFPDFSFGKKEKKSSKKNAEAAEDFAEPKVQAEIFIEENGKRNRQAEKIIKDFLESFPF